MKKAMKRTAAALLALAAAGMSAGCSDKPDTEGYVEATLDAIYHRDCKAYADLINVSEDQAEEEIEKTFMENMEAAFAGDTSASDEDKAAYIDAVREVYKLARYEVTGSEEKDGGYIVTVSVQPCTVFENLESGVEEKITQALDAGTYSDDQSVSYVTQYLNEAADKNEYGSKVDVEVKVTEDEEGVCQISEEDLMEVENALFPGAA